MNKVFIIQYGNNDLWYYTKNTKDNLIKDIKEYTNIDIFAMFLFKNIDEKKIWLRFNDKEFLNHKEPLIEEYAFKYKGNILKEINTEKYYENLSEKIRFINPTLFIKDEEVNDDDIKVLILSGHGGLFESLLDMSLEKNFSLNTQYLCNILKENKLDILLLDMCAMNYIEIVYEIFKDSKISNIILFNGPAPLEGIDINKILSIITKYNNSHKIINNILELEEYSLISISSKKIIEIEKLRDKINTISLYYYLSGKGEKLIVNYFKDDIEKIIVKGKGYNENSFPLTVMLNELNSIYEKQLYRKFKFSTKYILSEIIAKEIVPPSEDKYIFLTEESLKHIIHLNNTNISNEALEELYKRYIDNKKSK